VVQEVNKILENQHPLPVQPSSPNEVWKIIKALPRKKASGPKNNSNMP